MPYEFQEYPKWLHPEGRAAVIANTAHDEADFMQAWAAEDEARAAAAQAAADAEAKAAEEAAVAKEEADKAAAESDQTSTDTAAPKRGPGRPSNAEIAARAAPADPAAS